MTPSASPPVTITTLLDMKRRAEKFTSLTAYDASFARVLDDAGVDILLVGDSLGMVVQGKETTVPVTMDEMVYHASCVARGRRRALLMVDMPFMSYTSVQQALHNAARLMQEGGAHAVKLEGGADQAEIVHALVCQGVPVCAHLGLRPQSVHRLGGYKVQGRGETAARAMLDDALALQQAGADVLLLECVPAPLAAEITSQVNVPVIGIGAGRNVDGQVLVLHDLLGVSVGRVPKFSKNFLAGHDSVRAAVQAFVHAVKSGEFPGREHEFTS